MNDSPNCDITAAVLTVLRASTKPLMASEIALQLQAAGHPNTDKKVVNHLLYGPLKGQVRQDAAYHWTLTGQVGQTSAGVKDALNAEVPVSRAPTWARFGHYLDYYRECVAEDEHPESAYPLFRAGRDFLCPPLREEWSTSGKNRISLDLEGEGRDFAIQLRKRGTSGALFYAYPLYVRWIEKSQKGWTGGFGIPIFLQTIDYTLTGNTLEMDLVSEWPRVNAGFLSDMFKSVEERRQFMQELGILEADGLPLDDGLADIVRRMVALGLPCEMVESLDPAALPVEPLLSDIKAGGVYNRALIVIGEKSKYTAGLDKELALLKSAPDGHLSRSALKLFFGGTTTPTPTPSPKADALYEVVPLNEEQRTAVRSAMTQPLTVVTGPPGTGKSQVVTTILANAYLRGQRVLFTSRNHKAVEVVQERLNSLCGYPLAIRAGSRSKDRDLRSELVAFLTQMLSLTVSPEDHEAEKEAKLAYEHLVNQRDALWSDMEATRQARNRVDQCDRILEGASTRLDEAVWQQLCHCETLPVSTGLDTAAKLLEYHADESLGIFARIGRWLRQSTDFATVKKNVECLASNRALFGADPATVVSRDSLQPWLAHIRQALDYIQVLRRITEYRNALKSLKAAKNVETIAESWAQIDAQLSEWGARLIGAKGKLLPDRLKDPAQRHAFGEFKSILQRLANDQIGGRVYAQLMDEQEKLFAKISEILPVWCVTNLSARGSLPFDPALFDIVVIDEASQCDIASALPLFYRAKRAVVIGDPQQLSHISTIEKHREQQLQLKHGLVAGKDMPYTFAENSLFDLAVTCAGNASVISLKEHFRSHADIIGFSNRQWYGGSLRVCTDYRRLKKRDVGTPGVVWTDVVGETYTPKGGSTVNMAEAKTVCTAVEELLVGRDFSGTVGVVTPFRAQANRLWDLISARLPVALIDRAALIVDTAHGFQGDERDVMFFSPCVAPDLSKGGKYFLASTGNLFNVAITRARSLLHVVGNRSACATCGVPFVEAFAAYVDSLEHNRQEPAPGRLNPNDPRIGHWEQPFFDALKKAGMNPIPQYPVNQYRLDFAIIQGNTRLDVEVDGELYHKEWDGSRCKEDIIRDIRLSALGWKIKRFWVYRIRDEMDECVNEVIAALQTHL
jgi:very-short-patch-repair endonuclease